jgi:hypothetical protein
VTLALKHSLERGGGRLEDLYPLLDAESRLLVRGAFERIRGVKVEEHRSLGEVLASGEGLRLAQAIGEAGTSVEVTAVSELCSDIAPLLDLASVVRGRGWVFNVLQPCSPWVSAGDLDYAFQLYKSVQRRYRILGNSGAHVLTSIDQQYPMRIERAVA